MKTDWNIQDVMADAVRNSELLQQRLEIDEEELPHSAVFLTAGWSERFQLERERCISLKELRGYAELENFNGRDRTIGYGFAGAMPHIVLREAVQLCDHPTDPRVPYVVRQQVEMLRALGVMTFVLTDVADTLDAEAYPKGSVVVVDGLVTPFCGALPLMEYEYLSPGSAISSELNKLALENETELSVRSGGYVMTRGPRYAGQKYDQQLMRASGAACMGSRILPETALVALIPGHRALALAFIAASADEPSGRAARVERARDHSDALAAYLTGLIRKL